MRVTIIGGHGRVALLLAPLLVEAGHQVRSVIRNPDHTADVEAGGASAVVTSVEDTGTDDLVTLLAGEEAVVWSAGAGGGDPARTYAVDRDAAIRSMDAAERAGVSRYLMVSFSGAFPKDLVDQDDPFYPYMDAKITADDHLRRSSLDWTILGPGQLTSDPSPGTVNSRAGFRQGDETPRALVADVALAALTDDRTIGRTLVFGAGDLSIDDWFASLAE